MYKSALDQTKSENISGIGYLNDNNMRNPNILIYDNI